MFLTKRRAVGTAQRLVGSQKLAGLKSPRGLLAVGLTSISCQSDLVLHSADTALGSQRRTFWTLACLPLSSKGDSCLSIYGQSQ